MIHYTMNIRQTMLHLSGGLLLLLAPACTSEVDLEGGQPLEVTAEIVSSLSTRAVDATNYDKSSFSTDDEIQEPNRDLPKGCHERVDSENGGKIVDGFRIIYGFFILGLISGSFHLYSARPEIISEFLAKQ